MTRFDQMLRGHGAGELRRSKVEIFQINVGKLCNQTCVHCHVNAGPQRKEAMTRETMDRIIDWLARTDIATVDITGGAPEINPHFRYLVERTKALAPARHIMDRCNLTVFFEAGQEYLPGFLARHGIEVIASLPCYTAKNVDTQRGDGAFQMLGEKPAVFQPTCDGGYALIGLSAMLDVFTGISWSTSRVMAQTRARLNGFGIAFA